jgi:hypothetical protein
MLNWNGCFGHSLFHKTGGCTKVPHSQRVVAQQKAHCHSIDLVDVAIGPVPQFLCDPADAIERHDN